MKVKTPVNGKSTITKKKKSKDFSNEKGKQPVNGSTVKNGNISKKKQNTIVQKENKTTIKAAVKLEVSTSNEIAKNESNPIHPIFLKNYRKDANKLPGVIEPNEVVSFTEQQNNKKNKKKLAAVKLEVSATSETAKNELNPIHPIFLKNYRKDANKLPGVIEPNEAVPFTEQQSNKKNIKKKAAVKLEVSATSETAKNELNPIQDANKSPVVIEPNGVVSFTGLKENKKKKEALSGTIQSPQGNEVTKKKIKAQVPVVLTTNKKLSPEKLNVNAQEKKKKRKRKSRGAKQQNDVDNKTTAEKSAIKLPEIQSSSDDEVTVSPKSENNTSSVSKKKQKNRNKKLILQENQIEEVKSLDSSDDENTIFVGNLPNMVKKGEIEKLFKKYGKIQGIRLRSAAQSDQRIPKKVAVITQDFHKDSDNINAFVRFSEKFEARTALIANGSVFKGHHLRVDYAKPEKQHNSRASIFVGNLPFAVRDDELWETFKSCGEIESVRVIRDKETRVGKGFGYVNFKSPDGVELALQLENVTIQNRKLRIARQAEPKVRLKDNNNENESKKRKLSLSQNDNIAVENKKVKLENDKSHELKKKFQGEKSASQKLKKQTLKKKIKKRRNEKHKKSVASLLMSKPEKKI